MNYAEYLKLRQRIERLEHEVTDLQNGSSGRPRSIAITHLETAILWLTKEADMADITETEQ